MIIKFHKKFEKRYVKYMPKLRKQVDIRIQMFLQNPYNPILNNHPLHGKFEGDFSINITGDIRAIYTTVDDGVIKFIRIGTHSELYE